MMAKNQEVEFVFIQLGAELPAHLISNLKLVQQMFPLVKINLVTSPNVNNGRDVPASISQTEYESKPRDDALLKLKSQNPAFRSGFWRYSLERLFAIPNLHLTKPDKALLHIESDVLLLSGFPLQDFKVLEKIAWMSVDPEKDIASLMYFPNASGSQDFMEDLIEFVTDAESPTDMTVLNSLRRQNPDKYSLLPTWSPNLPQLHNIPKTEITVEPIFRNGLFDAAGVGMWLTGFDPRNNYGVTNYFATRDLRSAGFFVEPAAYPLEFSRDGELFYKNDSVRIQVYNLHIHSKSLSIFSMDWIEELTRLTRLSDKSLPHQEFLPRVLLGLIRSNFKEGTLLAFLFYSPPFKFLRLSYAVWKKMRRSL